MSGWLVHGVGGTIPARQVGLVWVAALEAFKYVDLENGHHGGVAGNCERNSGFPLEALLQLSGSVIRRGLEQFESDPPGIAKCRSSGIDRLVDMPHTAPVEFGLDAIRADLYSYLPVKFRYHLSRLPSMQAISGRPSPSRSAAAQAAAPMPPLSRISRVHFPAV
jgi:hypothetical protein